MRRRTATTQATGGNGGIKLWHPQGCRGGWCGKRHGECRARARSGTECGGLPSQGGSGGDRRCRCHRGQRCSEQERVTNAVSAMTTGAVTPRLEDARAGNAGSSDSGTRWHRRHRELHARHDEHAVSAHRFLDDRELAGRRRQRRRHLGGRRCGQCGQRHGERGAEQQRWVECEQERHAGVRQPGTRTAAAQRAARRPPRV